LIGIGRFIRKIYDEGGVTQWADFHVYYRHSERSRGIPLRKL